MFLRPCFLVVDREFAGSISTRKLVIETAKFNVITAYDYEEGLATLERFPNVDGVVITADRTGDPEAFLKLVRDRYPSVKRVLTGESPEGGELADRAGGQLCTRQAAGGAPRSVPGRQRQGPTPIEQHLEMKMD